MVTRQEWARHHIGRVPSAPAYGSAEWLALPDGPEKVAAVVRAAECWATEGDQLEERLRVEVEASQLAVKRLDDAEYVARRDGWRREYERRSYTPHPANRRGAA